MEQHAHPAVRPRPRVTALLPVFALIALVGGLFPSFSWRATLLVLGVGGALLRFGLSDRPGRHPAPRRLARVAAWWVLPAALLAVVEITDFALGSTYPHPTISVLADPVLDGYLPRALTWFGWQLAFYGLARR